MKDLNLETSSSFPVCPVPISPILLSKVRYSYFTGSMSNTAVLAVYPKWVNQHLYFIRARADHSKHGIPMGVNGTKTFYPCMYELILQSKRGNMVYAARVRKVFRPLSFLCESHKGNDLPFIYPTTIKNYYHGSFIWVTLTYDAKRCSKDDAWKNIGNELNEYLSKLRQKYGKFSILRNFEAFKNGYPHSHMLLLFHDHEFLIKKWKDPSGEYQYIIVSKSDSYGSTLKLDKSYFQHGWHSYVKATAVTNLGGVAYTLKYLTKESFTQNNYNTSAHLWLYKKQSYSMSQDFVKGLGNYTARY